jgi:glycosyltransferase involved in cell wall biosynthesis
MKVVGLVESLEHVSCRYRVRAFEPELRRRGWDLALEAIPPGALARPRLLRRHRAADVILLQRRLLHPVHLRLLRGTARRLVYDFDDAVLYRDSHSPKGLRSRRRAARFRRTVAAADAVIAGNGFLAAQAARFCDGRKVFVVPTCIDATAYPLRAQPPGRAGLDLVWIGSASTLQGLKRAGPLLDAIGRAVPGVRLRVICDRFPQFEAMPVFPCRWSAEDEIGWLAEAHVGISWHPDDVWSRGKCGLKVLQYMAAGLPVVANPVGVHTEMVEHHASGFLAEGAAEWVEAVRALAGNPELRMTLGRRGRQIVEERYNVSRWAPALDRLLSGRDVAMVPGP